jgi:hypothetical protein
MVRICCRQFGHNGLSLEGEQLCEPLLHLDELKLDEICCTRAHVENLYVHVYVSPRHNVCLHVYFYLCIMTAFFCV